MIRPAAVAGSFYPCDATELRELADDFLERPRSVAVEGRLRGLVVPHAGYAYSGGVAGAGFKLLAKDASRVKRALLLGPSHYAAFDGVCECGFDFWETPLGTVPVARLGVKSGLVSVIPQAHLPEHCLEVQLPFLQRVLKKFEITPLLCGDVDAGELAKVLEKEANGETVFIASSDLSHYLPYEDAVRRDALANESVPALDIAKFEKLGDACGKTPILVLMHLAQKMGWKGVFVGYKNSGDTAGGKARVVGYGCYAFVD